MDSYIIAKYRGATGYSEQTVEIYKQILTDNKEEVGRYIKKFFNEYGHNFEDKHLIKEIHKILRPMSYDDIVDIFWGRDYHTGATATIMILKIKHFDVIFI
jgi:hypothetical protein